MACYRLVTFQYRSVPSAETATASIKSGQPLGCSALPFLFFLASLFLAFAVLDHRKKTSRRQSVSGVRSDNACGSCLFGIAVAPHPCPNVVGPSEKSSRGAGLIADFSGVTAGPLGFAVPRQLFAAIPGRIGRLASMSVGSGIAVGQNTKRFLARARRNAWPSGGKRRPNRLSGGRRASGRPLTMESEQENRRGLLRLAYVVVMVGGVYRRERLQTGVKWEMADNLLPGAQGERTCRNSCRGSSPS